MTKEEIIKYLEAIVKSEWMHEHADFDQLVCKETLDMLKEQDNTVCTKERRIVNAKSVPDDCNIKACPWRTEAVQPKIAKNELWYECPFCKKRFIIFEDHYCKKCGMLMRWVGEMK